MTEPGSRMGTGNQLDVVRTIHHQICISLVKEGNGWAGVKPMKGEIKLEHTPEASQVPTLKLSPGMRRGSPKKIAAATFDWAAVDIGIAVLVSPSLVSPPPQNPSSKI